MSAELAWGAPVTYADLQRIPDNDTYRREIIDGQLIVSPAPVVLHQVCVANLLGLLMRSAPTGAFALPAPVDWKISDLSVVQPDIVVVRSGDLDGAHLSDVPLMVVEVLSPSTHLTDLGTKRMLYERSGVGDYWIVDPDGPRVTVLRLVGSAFQEIASVVGDEEYRASTPFEVCIKPSTLVHTTRP